ncbi:hypothetical protein J2S34_001384 [Nitrobacter winogradskyi]|uniref:Uncharacterized protein n=1 Tax=Nitrobacter winogradskyi TaxID=913 RepID=A0ACC6AGI1_NITWI|nr:hypothetical protein [Nitrobacter winogradskyi]MCP1998962.1 hypothetical protein [Nitrobacter winogradskyi]
MIQSLTTEISRPSFTGYIRDGGLATHAVAGARAHAAVVLLAGGRVLKVKRAKSETSHPVSVPRLQQTFDRTMKSARPL